MSADNWTSCPKCGKDFREDYGIGVHQGNFYVDYSGQCVEGCGFKAVFKVDKLVDEVKNAKT